VATKPPDWTVKLIPLLVTPPTVRVTLPVVAPDGTATVIELELQLVPVAAVPSKLTALVPCVEPKFVPAIVTDVPTAPDVGDTLVMLGVGRTVNDTPALETPLTVTTTFPVIAPLGTGATMLVALQLFGVAVVPLNVTVLVPCVEPKFVPVIVRAVPTGPVVGDRLVIIGASSTVKLLPLLATPPTVTSTLPLVAPLGTGTVIEVALQLLGVATVPLKVTVLVPCVEPKFVPVIVTDVPAGPDAGDKLVMLGVGRTVKLTPLLATPPTVTTTLPVVAADGTTATIEPAFQLTIVVANVPLKETVLVPCDEPKYDPLIATCDPAGPEVGDRDVIAAVVPGTIKLTPLLGTPLTVTTT
jgi:hypothetical protein